MGKASSTNLWVVDDSARRPSDDAGAWAAGSDADRVKAKLAHKITVFLDTHEMSTRDAQRRTGVSHADFGRIRNLQLGRFTTDRLITILNKLGHHVATEIELQPMGGPQRAARSAQPAPSNLQLRPSEKFAAIALEEARFEGAAPPEHQLAEGIWLLGKMPVEMGTTWEKWLGSLRSDSLRRSNCVIFAHALSERPEILDDEHSQLERLVTDVFNLLQLSGVVGYQSASLLTGSLVKNESQVRQVAVPHRYLVTHGTREQPITVARARRALDLVEPFRNGLGSSGRLRRGLSALFKGLMEEYPTDRLHQFVRSVEALVMPEQGKTGRQFTARCGTFLSSPEREALAQIYDTRSRVEHLHEWHSAFNEKVPNQEALVFRRTRQAEMLATYAYSRILEDPKLTSIFADDQSLAAFWATRERDRKQLWQAPLDLGRVK